MNPVFETQRLRLKPVTSGDRETLQSIFVDPYVRKYLCDDTILSAQQVDEMMAENLRLFAEERFGLWFIETKITHEIIGFVGLWYYFGESQPQLAYALLPSATKQGYATEAATKILEYCFNTLGYDYLIASADRLNVESHNVAQRLGMSLTEERIINDAPIVFFKLERSQLLRQMN